MGRKDYSSETQLLQKSEIEKIADKMPKNIHTIIDIRVTEQNLLIIDEHQFFKDNAYSQEIFNKFTQFFHDLEVQFQHISSSEIISTFVRYIRQECDNDKYNFSEDHWKIILLIVERLLDTSEESYNNKRFEYEVEKSKEEMKYVQAQKNEIRVNTFPINSVYKISMSFGSGFIIGGTTLGLHLENIFIAIALWGIGIILLLYGGNGINKSEKMKWGYFVHLHNSASEFSPYVNKEKGLKKWILSFICNNE